jgi:hypothetical protein
LVALDWKKKFQVYVVVFNFVIGSVLSRKDDKSFDHPIYFTSKQLIVVKINYTTTKIETLGMIYYV